MKRISKLASVYAAALSLATVLPSSAALLINLDATNKLPGNLNPWPQEAGSTVAGDFNSAGTTVPQVTSVGGVTAVQLPNNTAFYGGPGVPLTFSGSNPARTFEVWAYNPTVEAEETLLAIGRRGGPGGTNYSFNYGSSPLFGAFGGWTDAYDAGWGVVPAAGQWHYLVMTYDGDFTRFYADGQLSNYERPGAINTYQTNPSLALLPFIVGGQGNATSPFAPQGATSGISIARVRVHDVVLTPAQIAAQYAAEQPQFDVPAALTLTANNGLYLPGEPITLSYATANATSATITPSPGAVPSATGTVIVNPAGGPVTYTLTATKGATSVTRTVAMNPAVAVPTLPALLHRWSFNESNAGGAADTNCLDSVGANHGTSSGAQNATIRGTYNATVGTASAWTRSTNIGTAAGAAAVRLGGGGSATSAYIDLPNSIMSGLTQVTFEGWMTLNGAQTWSRYFDLGTNSAGEQTGVGGSGSGTEYILISAQVGGTTTSRRMSMRDNNVENLFDAADPVTYNTEFHFAAVYDPLGNAGVSPALKYYKNGTLVGTLTTAFRPQDMVFVNNWLGRSNFGGDANTNGTYNEFRIWSVPLTPAKIAESITAGPDGTPPAVPATFAFKASPSTVYRGQSTTLSWLADGAGTIAIDNGVTVANPASLASSATASPASTVTYTATISDGRTASTVVSVLDSVPVACAGSVFAPYQSATPVNLATVNVGPLTYSIITGPLHGTLSGTAPALTYTPAGGYTGPDSFTWKANDGFTDSNIASATITVGAPAAAPTNITADTGVIRTDDGIGNLITLLQATDANSQDTFTWSLVSGAGSTNNSYFTIAGNQLISSHDFSADNGQTISIRVRATDSTGASFEKVLIFPVQPADLHVKINEIYYNSPNNLVAAEFVELYNPTGGPVNLAGWQFTKGISFVFPNAPASIIPAGGYVVVAENPTTIQAIYGVSALGPWIGAISNDGDELILRNNAGVKVDGVQFANNFPWPVPANGDGPSMELVNPGMDNDIGGHWRAATTTAGAPWISRGSTNWRYRPNGTEVPAGWRLASFTENAEWRSGIAPVGIFKLNNNTSLALNLETNVALGTQLTGAVTGIVPPAVAAADMGVFVSSNLGVDNNFTINYRSVAMRRTVNIGPTVPGAVILRVLRSDAAIVWINGVEVARFGFPEGAPSSPVFDTTAIYEHANDPWSEMVITNAASFLVPGDNQVAIEGWVKGPRLRSAQEDVAQYNVFDFALDLELAPIVNAFAATPAAQNSVFAVNCPPAVRQVDYSPNQPKAGEPITVTARVSDRQGLASVQLKYQVNSPGAYIPSIIPRTANDILILKSLPPSLQYSNSPHPDFENPATWATVTMTDADGDGQFTATIPGQTHRTLVRYRVVATDLASAVTQAPPADDPSKNLALFVYNGVPAYAGPGGTFTSAQLTTLPVYHWLMRPADRDGLLAYTNANFDQFANNPNFNILLGRRHYNFEGSMVYDGKVYDHVRVRLRGGNSRYNGAGKRHFRFKFPKGYPFAAKDNKGRPFPRDWDQMLFNKLFGNKGDYDWGLPYVAGVKMWGLQGIPMPYNQYVHFRMITTAADAPSPTGGDFWGLYQALELPDGKNFLKSRNLPAGNFYKLSDWIQNGEMDERYQAPGAPDFAEDFDNLRYNIHQHTPQAIIERDIQMPMYYKYQAVVEAIRHYDIFTEPTGRHRMKNFYWYFNPGPLNPDGSRVNRLGQCWIMPYDWDASFGPNWNGGQEVVLNALYNYNPVPDSPTWPVPTPPSRTAAPCRSCGEMPSANSATSSCTATTPAPAAQWMTCSTTQPPR